MYRGKLHVTSLEYFAAEVRTRAALLAASRASELASNCS